ncbi:hypothetical protein BaRGS_00012651 [Batillaria attramentaria]|uniref:Sacsin/Nov domain-containing protein n=1 Tax=Batillaria attramentaria TaxID=370345 RepID=A0ABD0L9C7_9CAEN
MPVHVNGTFALTSSRRSLLVQTEDDLNATDFNWNEALFGDAVCRAYLLLLENLEQEAFADFTHYFNLWPRSSSAEIKLFQSFYRRMVSDRNKVFPVPHPGNWVDFQEAWILEPALRESECGQLAWSALNQFWNKEGQLVDVPSTVCKLIEEGGQLEALSGRVISTEEFFRDVFFPNIHSDTWKNEERDRLTLYALDFFLSGARLSPSQFLTSIARNAAFVSTTCGNLQQPVDLYDPSSPILIELFDGEDKFPSETFSKDNVLQTLQNLGLRSNTNVKPDDLTSVATSVEQIYISGQSALALRKAEGLWKLLVNHGVSIDAETLKQLARIQCLPCLQEKPSSFPSSLPLNCQNILERPSEMCLFEHIQLVGCVMPVVRKDMPPSVASALGIASRPAPGQVLNHLKTAVQALNLNSTDDVDRYRRMETKIFKELEIHSPEVDVVHALQQERCVLVESGDSFVCPSKFWIERRSADIQVLSPYKYQLPRRLKQAEKLFRVLGASQYQDEIVLQKVLEEIRDSHENQIPSQEIFDRDLQLVKQILDVLRCSQSVPKGTVLLPVEHSEGSVLKFKPASECTIGCWSESMVTMAAAEGEEEIILVFQEIHSGTAQALGALQMRDRALTGVEGLDFDYEQREELTTRLHNLLNDSYTDGFSVPKELIQNADDAGAEEVRFLLDERENLDDRSNLISDDLASLQGPAIWAYNDAVFTDEDFENIIKLGAGTKKEDASKVGRFGLGFNAVYNLTDVPSFISRHTMAIFDPHKKYLRGGAGLKMDFRRQVNRSLLSRMPQQFQPFQGVFDCRLKNEGDVMYEGTLFRFPLRTPEQAAQSKLKGESYSQDKRREFLRLLLHRAGSLLMFTQNVRKVQVFYLSADCTDPSNAECLLTVNKTSRLQILQPLAGVLNSTILQFCTEHWPGITDLQILEQVTIEKEVKEAADSVCKVKADHVTTHWRLAWATGTGASAEAAQRYRQEGLVPLAGVAVQFKENNIIMPSESPSGFYTSGHLFCFLPLPEEMVHMKLQVHINGTFALASSRRHLLVKTEDDIRSSGHDWNSVLFGDAVCRAYLLLLENLTLDVRPPYDCYFGLLPDSGEASLDQNFYKRLVQDGNRVFPVPGQENWVAFSDAWFLDPDFRDSECGQLAWDAVKLFWDRDNHLVDVPTTICRLICGQGQAEAFQNRVITVKAFFTSFLFPNIDSNMWVSTNRDRLVLLALMQDDREIQELVANHYCIPCRDSVELRRPCDLIHPEGAASKLYSPQDHRFPQGGSRQAHDDSGVDFSSYESLSRLEKLGMIKDDLPWEMVLERARSVHSLMTDDRGSAIYRAVSLIDYLSSVKDFAFRINCCPSEVKEALSVIRFLPVLHKPDHWPFPWGAQDDDVLAAPNELFSDTMKFLVGCNAKLLDLKAMEQHRSVNMWKTVLESLGVRMQNKPQDETLLEKSIDQLLTVAECVQENESIDKQSVQNICSDVYSYLSNSLRSSEDDGVRNCIAEHLCGRNVVWTGTVFVPSTRAAFRLGYDCQPYLFKVEPRQSYRPFLELVGVKETFDSKDVLWVLRKIHEEHEGQQLSRPVINTVSRAAQLLREVAEAGMQELGEREVFLPDRHGHMMPTSHLCLDDCPWLEETETMKFVHDAIPPETARALRVETKRGKDYDELMLPMEFGQSEKLTVRIKRLLEGYTFDSSLFKELLQNADDAGATEIKFIIDRRRLGKERVPEGWSEHLQGPALCVYNNKSFTTIDMQGIQNLGQGSKGDDLLKTGKYGVGFNAVYHITDVPSFWTRENDENEVICVLDPNCQYVRNSSYSKPGVKLGNVERVRQAYPDMYAGYLGQCLDTTKPGTMFRFPLRSQEMAKTSEIKNQLVTSEDITKLLEDFRPEMSSCLLFLNNLQKIGIYSVNGDGTIKVEYEIEKHVHEKSSGQLKDLKSSLQQASLSISNRTVGLRDIPEYEAVLHMKFTDSQGKEEEWLTVNRVGFTDTNSLSEQLLNEWQLDHFRLLPRGGVAVRLAQKKVGRGTQTSSEEYHAFCILPLPVVTKLPMHVNGYFALDHETRRNLWDNDGDARTEWNTATALQLIVPAYITAVQQLKTELFPEGETLCNSSIASRLRYYHAMFPDPEAAPSDFWKKMIHEFYRQTARKELAIFPVSNTASQLFEWMPAYKGYGFPGYFSDLVNFFRKQREAQQERRVVLSQGGQSGPCHHGQGQESDRNQAKRLQALLKDLNMKVLDTPFHVYSYFKQSGVSGVQEVTPDSVLHFLKSAQSGHHDACTVRDLPRHVSNTPFKSSDNVRFLVEYVQNCCNFLHQLGGLPLCLRQSDNLYFFRNVSGS